MVGLHLKDILFKSRITHTLVNGELVYTAFKVKDIRAGKRLLFER
jgi:dihydroorotase